MIDYTYWDTTTGPYPTHDHVCVIYADGTEVGRTVGHSTVYPGDGSSYAMHHESAQDARAYAEHAVALHVKAGRRFSSNWLGWVEKQDWLAAR